jgi:hypothetical protein
MTFAKIIRENNIYYRRGRRAVGSHTRWGERNPNALSSHLNGELDMTAEDRKKVVLPCGRTIAESWGALRKCWLAFCITKSQGDRNGMVEYARRIRKIQGEMGIKPTDFDPDILDENTAMRIDMLYRGPSAPLNEEAKNGEQWRSESKDLDYEEIMTGSITDTRNVSAPREEIFTSYESRRDKSCPSPADRPRAKLEKKATNYSDTCYFGPLKPADASRAQVARHNIYYDAQCHAGPAKLDQDTFAASDPEESPNYAIHEGKSCDYPPTKVPIYPIYYDKSCPSDTDNFAAPDPQDNFAAPDPQESLIYPIYENKSCGYPPTKVPIYPIYYDKSCPSDHPEDQVQNSKKEKDTQRRSKSCPY